MAALAGGWLGRSLKLIQVSGPLVGFLRMGLNEPGSGRPDIVRSCSDTRACLRMCARSPGSGNVGSHDGSRIYYTDICSCDRPLDLSRPSPTVTVYLHDTG